MSPGELIVDAGEHALNPGRRKEVKRLTGKTWVPVLVTDDDSVISGSKEIAAWAQEHPARPV